MDLVTVDQAMLIVTLATAVSLFVQQVVKPVFEALPIGQPTDTPAHDAILRLAVLLLNGGLLYVASQSTPLFAGTPWYDLMIYAVGQSIGSHAVFKLSQQPPSEPADANSAPQVTVAPGQLNFAPPANFNAAAQTQIASPLQAVHRATPTRPFRTLRDVGLPQQPGDPPAWLTGAPQPPPAPPPTPSDAASHGAGQNQAPPEAGR